MNNINRNHPSSPSSIKQSPESLLPSSKTIQPCIEVFDQIQEESLSSMEKNPKSFLFSASSEKPIKPCLDVLGQKVFSQLRKECDLKEQEAKEALYFFEKPLIVELQPTTITPSIEELTILLTEKYTDLLSFCIDNRSFIFYHSRIELEAFVNQHPDLQPFFYCGESNKGCFTGNISSKGFVNSRHPKKLNIHTVDARKDFLKKAEEFFSSYPDPNDFYLDKEYSIQQKETLEKSTLTLFETILADHEGICIGELPNDPFPKEIIRELIENLEHSKLKLDTLFLAPLMYDTMQPILDRYMQSSKDMPEILKTYLTALDKSFNLPFNTFETLIIEAKKNNIRVVGLSTTRTHEIGMSYGQDTPEQDLVQKYVGAQIMAHEKGGKYIALMPVGIAQIQRSPFVVIRNEQGQPYSNKSSSLVVKKIPIKYADFYITSPPIISADLEEEDEESIPGFFAQEHLLNEQDSLSPLTIEQDDPSPLIDEQEYLPPFINEQDYPSPLTNEQEYLPPSIDEQEYLPPFINEQEYLPPLTNEQVYFPPLINEQEYLSLSINEQAYLSPLTKRKNVYPLTPLIIEDDPRDCLIEKLEDDPKDSAIKIENSVKEIESNNELEKSRKNVNASLVD